MTSPPIQSTRLRCSRHSAALPQQQHGLAIGVILLVVVLLAAIGAAISLSSRTRFNQSGDPQSRVWASTILSQATTIHDGFTTLYMQTGCWWQWEVFAVTSGNQCGLMDPSSGTLEPQTPPPSAFISSSYDQWVYKVDGSTSGNPVVKLMGVGVSSSADYMIAVAGLTQGVCQQINAKLRGTTTIPAPAVGTLAAWSTPATAIDLSADSTVNGIFAQCIQTTDGGYVFYNVIWAV